MRRICIFLILMIMNVCVNAQTFSLVSLNRAINDLTGKIQSRKDFNGKDCGLLIVESVLENITFQGNIVGDPIHDAGEYLIYLSAGSKELRIKHPKLLPFSIDMSSILNEPIQSGVTYRLVLAIPYELYPVLIDSQNMSHEAKVTSLPLPVQPLPDHSESQSNSNATNRYNTEDNITQLAGLIDIEVLVTYGMFKHEPLVGATIKVIGKDPVYTTDIDGRCFLTGVSKDAEILIQYIGKKTKKVKVKGNKKLSVRM